MRPSSVRVIEKLNRARASMRAPMPVDPRVELLQQLDNLSAANQELTLERQFDTKIMASVLVLGLSLLPIENVGLMVIAAALLNKSFMELWTRLLESKNDRKLVDVQAKIVEIVKDDVAKQNIRPR